MRFAELSQSAMEKIKARLYDQILEKHEGPERWKSFLEYGEPELLDIGGRWVLLPVMGEHLSKIRILRTIVSDDGRTLTIFLRNTWYSEVYNIDPDAPDTRHIDGFLAVCERVPGEDFYIADVYHEWFIVINS